MSQSNDRNPPPLLNIGAEIARGMVTLHLRGASQFVQTQVEFLSAMQSASAPEETRRVQRQYIEAMCNGAQQHAEGLMAVFANVGANPQRSSRAQEPDDAGHAGATPTTAETTAPTTSTAATAAPAVVSPTHRTESDDLTRVSGIGRVFATKLAALGITRFSDLADLDLAELEDENHPLHDYRARVVSDEWIEQARALAG